MVKIQTRLTTYIALIMTGITLVSTLVIYKVNWNNVLEESKKTQIQNAKMFASQIESSIHARIDHTERLADLLLKLDLEDKETVQKFLDDQYYINSDIELGYMLIDPSGNSVIAETPVVENRNRLTFGGSIWLKKALEQDQVVLSSPRIGRASGNPIIILAKSLRDKNGKILAVLASPVLLSAKKVMQSFFTRENMVGDRVIVISRANSIFIVPPYTHNILDPVPAMGNNHLYDLAMDGFEGALVNIDAVGMENISASKRLNILDWFVISRIPAEEAFRNVKKQTQLYIIDALLLIVIMVGIIDVFLIFYFTPLRSASEMVKKMALKESELKLLPVHRNDEIGVLLKGFNELVTTVQSRTKKLESLSQVDGLTKLYNIRHMKSIMDMKWREYRRRKENLCLIMIDIDFFKKYNDQFGHLAGDLCLVKVAGTFKEKLLRPTDIAARYGGEEFIILVDGDEEEGKKVAEYLRLSIKNLNIQHPQSQTGILTISLGLASCIPGNTGSIETLLNNADKALYKSKEKGRDRYTTYSQL